MVFKSETEKVAKMTRAIIDGSSRRFKEKNLAPLYNTKHTLTEQYVDIHFNILTDFPPGPEMQEMIDILSLCYERSIDLTKSRAWHLYYRKMSTLLADKIASLTNISRVAFMEQLQQNEEVGESSKWAW